MKEMKLLILLIPMMLIGCQTTSTLKPELFAKKEQPAQAKKELKNIIKDKMYHSFNYQTNAKISYESAESCGDLHDKKYVELLKRAEQESEDINSSIYDQERQVIKSAYIDCKNKQKPIKSDSKVLKARQAYLTKPLQFQANGTYQPLSNKATVVPNIGYKIRNLDTNIELPIYINLKKGDIYLWADSVAYLNSSIIDKKLGTKWKNKWLKISLNDGSFPENFGGDLIKLYIDSKKYAYDQEPLSVFGYVSPAKILNLLPDLDVSQQQNLANADHIISRTYDDELIEHQSYLQSLHFLKSITKKYPTLLDEKATKKALKNQDYGRVILMKYIQTLKKSIDDYEASIKNSSSHKVDFVNKITQYYGIKKGELSWIHVRVMTDEVMNKDFTLDIQTIFEPANDQAFANLPSDQQTPNDKNIIHLKDYMVDLSKRREKTTLPLISSILGHNSTSNSNENSKDINTEADQEESTTEIVTIEAPINDKQVRDVSESSQCVLMSVSIDMMCDADVINVNDPKEVKACQQKKQELQEIYKQYCK